MTDTPMKHSATTYRKTWLGYLFLAYTLVCLWLALTLSHGLHTQTTTETPAPIQITKQQPPEDVQARKQAFYTLLLPAIEQQNTHIRQQRQTLLDMQAQLTRQHPLSVKQHASLQSSTLQYRVNGHTETTELLAELLNKVDEIPASMVLAQGAMESAWGRSRFAREANNYFGQWCFTPGCGLVPSQRSTGARHEVARFASIDEAVAAYFRNINSHPAYQLVRQRRSGSRQQQHAPDSLTMIEGLEKYSARGQAYIEELKGMIQYNKLQRFDANSETPSTTKI